MRAAVVVLGLAASAAVVFADTPHTSAEGKYSVRFPGAPKVSEQSVKSDLGTLTVHTATYADSAGSTYLVSFTDYPADAVAPDKLDNLFDGIRDSVVGSDGKLDGRETVLKVGEKMWPGREFVVEKGKQRIKFQVFFRENRLYQVALIGSESFVTGRDAKKFFDSFEPTK